MKNYKMIVSYEGTRYNGWQKQGNTPNTIQEKLETVLFKMCGRQVEIFGSGRTDAGVHAKGQTVSFKAETEFEANEIRDYFNKYLPEDIAVISVEEAEERFHARLLAKRKTYEYRIFTGDVPEVFGRRTRYNYQGVLDVRLMKKGAELLIGKHDFKAFCTATRMKKSTVREIYYIDVSKNGEEIVITVCGNGFLYNMVRIITGTLIEIGRGERRVDSITEIINSRDRKNAGYTAPPEGLTLLSAEY